MGILDKVKDSYESVKEGVQEGVKDIKQGVKEMKDAAAEEKRKKEEIRVTTGDFSVDYEVIECVFAMESHQEGFFETGAEIGTAFTGLRQQLRELCYALGGNAVVNCQFEQKSFTGESMFGNAKAGIQVFAYGTAVRFKSSNWLRMGDSYALGINGVERDLNQALNCYSKAADSGNTQAMMRIAEISESNGDQTSALSWCQEAVACGYTEAAEKFGYQPKDKDEEDEEDDD